MANEIAIKGLSELQAQLDMLADNVQRKLMRGALRAGQKTVLEKARSEVHSVSGDLTSSLRVSTSARNGVVKATVKVGNTKAFYAHMVEFGTAAHLIEPKNGKALTLGGREYASLDHPGAKKHPFMRPALDAAAVQNSPAFLAVVDYLTNKISKELDKLPDEADAVS
jgi:HK97 gp10 family phage protein